MLAELARIDELQTRSVTDWHRAAPPQFGHGFGGLLLHQHYANYSLWHLEDIARIASTNDSELASAKREIDRLNKERHELIEAIDDAIVAALEASGHAQHRNAPLNSESPASIVDRCSILAIRIYHREQQLGVPDLTPELRLELARELELVRMHRSDLLTCVRELMDGVLAGTRRFKVYRHFKAYAGDL